MDLNARGKLSLRSKELLPPRCCSPGGVRLSRNARRLPARPRLRIARGRSTHIESEYCSVSLCIDMDRVLPVECLFSSRSQISQPGLITKARASCRCALFKGCLDDAKVGICWHFTEARRGKCAKSLAPRSTYVKRVVWYLIAKARSSLSFRARARARGSAGVQREGATSKPIPHKDNMQRQEVPNQERQPGALCDRKEDCCSLHSHDITWWLQGGCI